jgi:hypothetical protein
MHQIQLNDQLYQEAKQRAAEAGFVSVDEYVADVLQTDLREEPENLPSAGMNGFARTHADRSPLSDCDR